MRADSVAQKHKLLGHSVERAAGGGQGFGQGSEQPPRGISRTRAILRSAAERLLGEGFVELQIRRTACFAAALEEGRIEAGEHEKLISRRHLQVEFHAPVGTRNDPNKVGSVGETSGDVLQRIIGRRGDPLGHQPGHVVREIWIAEVGLEEGVADQHVKVKTRRDLDCRGGVEEAAQDLLQVEQLAPRIWVAPEFFQVQPLLARCQHGSEKIQIRPGEAVPTRRYFLSEHLMVFNKMRAKLARKLLKFSRLLPEIPCGYND